MKVVLSFTLLACVLLASDARIDNKFATEHEKKPQERSWSSRREPVVHLDKEVPEDGNVIEADGVKVKGHRSKITRRDRGDHGNGYKLYKEEKAYLETVHPGNGKHGVGDGGGGGSRQSKAMKKEGGLKWKGRKSANEGKSSAGRKAWKKLSNYKHEDSDLCSKLKCKRKHVCLVNGDTGVAECIPKRILRQSRKFGKSVKANGGRKRDMMKKQARLNKVMPDKVSTKKHATLKKMTGSKELTAQHKKAHRMAKKIKNKAEKFQDKYQEKKRRHLHHLKDVSEQKRSSLHDVNSLNNALPLKTAHTSQLKYCSQKELDVMGKGLLDWFKVLQDQTPQLHIIQKRNSKKKELHEQDECICQAPVRSEFLRLDKDQDEVLSMKELDKLETNGYEHCIKPFIDSCDHDKDGSLSDREWCCCFADVLPPCLAEMKKVPAALTMGEPVVLPGAFVPECDSDGFYKAVQCHGSTGYCWCVDRNGKTIEGTHTRGMPNCEDAEKVENSDDTDVQELE